ncbi:hypothetical protein Tco_0243945, partial [Tanacetum coccineum]
DGSEFRNRNLQAILANGVVSCSTLSDQGYVWISQKNHKKTIKSEQARTRESEEYKAEARKAKPQPIP